MTDSHYSVLMLRSQYMDETHVGVAVWHEDGRRGAAVLGESGWDRVAAFMGYDAESMRNVRSATLGMLTKFLTDGMWDAHPMSAMSWRVPYGTITDPSDPTDVARIAEHFLPSSEPVTL